MCCGLYNYCTSTRPHLTNLVTPVDSRANPHHQFLLFTVVVAVIIIIIIIITNTFVKRPKVVTLETLAAVGYVC